MEIARRTPLSESSPTASEDAIEQMMRQRLRLGIPFYRIANGDVIRFNIEELFLWEMHHLRPCRYPA